RNPQGKRFWRLPSASKHHLVNNPFFQQIPTTGIADVLRMVDRGVLGIFRPKTTKCSGGPAVCGLQRGITFFEIPIWALFE
ncbi:hypothetical protein, partial [Enterobacter hormaechei]|uniref:hypothetical protein n=1 Tax=Enterobacter hormaechei TaxID=158836 RepID=UPI0039C68DC9